MLRFLDAYVLDAIGALDDATLNNMTANVTRLRQALHTEGETWQQVVEAAMSMPRGSADGIRTAWRTFVNECCQVGQTPQPLKWAHDLVDARFR